jgi:DNA-binding PadR family transcriptional regulator
VILYKLFPEKYSLVGFPEFPDTLRVNRAMTSHCITAGYIDGTLKRNSYFLTPKGRIVAEDLLDQIESGTTSQRKRSDLKQSKYIRLVKGVSDTTGFEKFSAKHLKEIKKFDVCESLHCTIDADEEHLKRNLETLTQHAINTKKISNFAVISESVLEYLQYIESNWEELMK